MFMNLGKDRVKIENEETVLSMVKGSTNADSHPGWGDLASGITLRLHRSGLRIAIVELPQLLVVRRLVSFAEADTGLPSMVMGHRAERVLRSPADGFLQTHAQIGDMFGEGQPIAGVAGMMIKSPFFGALRGLLREGTKVKKCMKVGDVDPRGDPSTSRMVSDKARSLGGAVLEAILSRRELRPLLWI
ncbi:MAG: hypothetical protein R6U57_13400 [Anaerolineales bacterium]